MRILRVAVRLAGEDPEPRGEEVAAFLRARLPRDPQVEVSHVSTVHVTDRSVELAAFVAGDEEQAGGLRAAVLRALGHLGAAGRWWVLAPRDR